MNIAIAREAIRSEIKRLSSDQKRLQDAFDALGGDETASKATKASKRRLRLKDDVAADLATKIVKAVKAYKDGASRANILEYLSRNGYTVGHHFNEPHLTKMVAALAGGESPQIKRHGDKGQAKYFVV